MLKPSISLDAHMSAAAALERLALQGIWADITHPAAKARLEKLSKLSARPIEDIARTLAQDVRRFGAAIRRQWGTHVLWYARELQEVLVRCTGAPAHTLLIDVLDLHEGDALPPIHIRHSGETILSTGVVVDEHEPVAVSFAPDQRPAVADILGARAAAPAVTRSVRASASEAASPKQAWPRIDAPDLASAGKPFEVAVGFSDSRQAAVAGGQVTLKAAAGVTEVDVTVDLTSGPEVSAPDGWSRTMKVRLDDLLAAEVKFVLVGAEPADPARPTLTMIGVRYVVDGVVCGTAARPLIILPSSSQNLPPLPPGGEGWQTMGGASPITLSTDANAPDLTIEITKPDGDATSGRYVCQLCSPHAITSARGPFPIDLGQDAKTYAREIVDEMRVFGASPLLDTMLESIGRLVAQRLPAAAFEALHEVAARVAPNPPAVLIVSTEPYVPWELAWVDPPLDTSRPRYLGAQALVGRWLRDAQAQAPAAATAPRPATHPSSTLPVRNIAVMAAWYKATSGLKRLPMAEAEAKAIAQGWQGLALVASAQSMRQLLQGTLERGFEQIGGVEAVHFAGHGDFDPARPEGSALFLEDGTPLRSTMFRAARYGGERQPLMFLNACMLGIGGELLGDMAGFPGNSLRGGFGGVIGALWEVDDQVAHDIALEFWERALPRPSGHGEPVGAILRDLRAKFAASGGAVPVSTYLAYVYYGHPRLQLERMA